MKRLTLLRHAKSSWKDLSLPDAMRPLNKRGKRSDAPEMGLALRPALTPTVDYLIVASPAKRALSTARLFAEDRRGIALDDIVVDDRVYAADLGERADR